MSLFNDTCPPLSLLNKVNGRGAYARNNCQRISRDASTKSTPDVNDLPLGQLVSGGIFSTQVNQSCAPLMFSVFSQRNPFKILWSIIQLVSVNMINSQAFRIAINKPHSHKPVNKNFWAFGAKFCRNNLVAVLRNPRFYFCLRSFANKSLQ